MRLVVRERDSQIIFYDDEKEITGKIIEIGMVSAVESEDFGEVFK